MDPWLILADDLTGAADSAIAFAKHNMTASVVFNEAIPSTSTQVIAIDVGSRVLSGPEAAAQQIKALAHYIKPTGYLFKKIDSLVRGQPASETAASIDYLKQQKLGSFALIAPAFPSVGRTTEQGMVFVQGQRLEETDVWQRDHSYETSDLVTIFSDVGIKTCLIPLIDVQKGPAQVAQRLMQAIAQGYDAAVCDATTDHDLAVIAQASLPMKHKLFWIGTGGLAQHLAMCVEPDHRLPPYTLPARTEGILTIVGSLTKVSRSAIHYMHASNSVRSVRVDPDEIFLKNTKQLTQWSEEASALLKDGYDVLLELTETTSPDLSKSQHLAHELALAFKNTVEHASALLITGGETAAAFLNVMGVHGIRLIDDVETGVPAGITLGRIQCPIVTKSGAFGTEKTLMTALEYLRSVNKKGSF